MTRTDCPMWQRLQDLLYHWKREQRRRAGGGLWALAGFSLQAGWYLLRFFQRVAEGNVEPAQLAEMERLSDLLCPDDGKFVLIQVKRALTKVKLIEAVEEFYLITDLCRQQTPSLLPYLRFQIACRERKTPLAVAELPLNDVISEGGDADCWRLMLKQFDASAPIVVKHDPLDALHVFLWHAGLRDPTEFIDRCLGQLLAHFSPDDPDTAALGRRLASDFLHAHRREGWRPRAYVLTIADVEESPDAATSTRVLIDQRPRFEDLRDGCFRERPSLFAALWQALLEWLDHPSDMTQTIPVFWIHGRSGTGKSVLLLQLAARLLDGRPEVPLLQLNSGDDLLDVMHTMPDRFGETGPAARATALVDDLYQLRTRDDWDEAVQWACARRIPPLAVITCGPTEQLEQFKARHSDPFQITPFRVPQVDPEECRQFIEWHEHRTHQKQDPAQLTTENTLLVQLIFELAQGKRLPDFARRFRRRLEQVGLFDAARAILAANAVYVEAPFGILTDDRVHDALERLCAEDQMHFRTTPTGIWLAHSHLSFQIFREWTDAPATLAKTWGRELVRTLTVLENTQRAAARTLLHRVLMTERMSDLPRGTPADLPDRRDVIRELYRLHVDEHGGVPADSLLPCWLDMITKVGDVGLTPDLVECAVSAMSDESRASTLHGSVGARVWELADTGAPHEAIRLRETTRQFFTRWAGNPGIGTGLTRIAVREDDKSQRLVTEWLERNAHQPDAFLPLAPLVRQNPQDARIRQRAVAWLEANQDHPQDYWLLAVLVASASNDAAVKERAVAWLDANQDHPRGYQVLAALVASAPDDPAVKDRAVAWLDANQDHPQANQVLAPLVRGNRQDETIRQRAVAWLDANQDHPQDYWLFAALVASAPDDAAVKERAVAWLDANQDHPRAYQVLEALVASAPDDPAVKDWAVAWLDQKQDRPRAYQVLVALVASVPDDPAVKDWAVAWLDRNQDHPQGHQVLAPLVRGYPQDETIRQRAVAWLDANQDHPQAYQVLVALVASAPDDPAVKDRAIAWLDQNQDHPQGNELLRVIVAKSARAQDWLRLGEEYVRRPGAPNRQGVLAALVTAGEASPPYVELMFEYLDAPANRASKRHRNYVLHNLARGLARNPQQAVEYLNGPFHEDRKRTVAVRLAAGLKGLPDYIKAFADVAYPRLEPPLGGWILKSLVRWQVASTHLNDLVADWLTKNVRRQEYGGLLDALHDHPDCWSAIKDILPREIITDFENRPATDTGRCLSSGSNT